MGKYYSINVKNNIKQFTKGLTRFQKRQVPFVAARTLTDVAFKVRFNAIDKSFPQAFKNSVVASRMAKGRLRVIKAQKRDYNMGMLSAKVLDKSSNPLEYLVTHQRGGTKRPKSGDYIAVPSSKIKKKLGIRRNPQWRPTAVRNMKDVRVVKSGKYVRGSEVLISIGGFFNEVDAMMWAKMQTELWLKTADERRNIHDHRTLH